MEATVGSTIIDKAISIRDTSALEYSKNGKPETNGLASNWTLSEKTASPGDTVVDNLQKNSEPSRIDKDMEQTNSPREESKSDANTNLPLEAVQLSESKTGSKSSKSSDRPSSRIAKRTFYGCGNVKNDYEILEKLGEGTFGEVHKAQSKSSLGLVALKKIFLHNEKEGFPLTALREIRILKSLNHHNIIPLLDMAVERGDRSLRKRGSVYMVTPYMEHDLAGLLGNPKVRFSLPQIKCYLYQLFDGINYLHQNHYLHRDIKAANILIDNWGIVKIADFGLARRYDEDTPTVNGAGLGRRRYTGLVVTRWYRPPELILGETRYTTAVDMWGIGCVFAEMFRRKPIIQGNSDIDQGHKIFQLVGSPTEETMPGWSQLPAASASSFGSYPRKLEAAFSDLDKYSVAILSDLLTLDPLKRLTALGGLAHKYFKQEPLPSAPDQLPKYSDSHELDTRKDLKEPQSHAPQVVMHGGLPPPEVNFDFDSAHGDDTSQNPQGPQGSSNFRSAEYSSFAHNDGNRRYNQGNYRHRNRGHGPRGAPYRDSPSRNPSYRDSPGDFRRDNPPYRDPPYRDPPYRDPPYRDPPYRDTPPPYDGDSQEGNLKRPQNHPDSRNFRRRYN